jgi:hypothetical protein
MLWSFVISSLYKVNLASLAVLWIVHSHGISLTVHHIAILVDISSIGIILQPAMHWVHYVIDFVPWIRRNSQKGVL